MAAPGTFGEGLADAAALDRASRLLARAFKDYPLYRQLYPEEKRRERALRWYMAFVLRYCLKYGEVFTTPERDGFLTMLKDADRFPYRKLLATGLLLGPLRMGVVAFWRLIRHDNHVSDISSRLAPPGAWYLWIVGVDPAVQWKRLGWELMRQAMEAADAARVPCYADTDRREMLGFLLFHGFEVLHEGREPSSGTPFWVVCRHAIMPAERRGGAGQAEGSDDDGRARGCETPA